MKYQSYPKYKDSGVEWIGEIPEEWYVGRLGFLAWVRARLGWKGLKAEEYVDDGYVLLSTPNIKGKEIDFAEVSFIDQSRYLESPEIALRQGDVLLAKDGSTLGTVNVIRSLPRPSTVNSSIAVLTPNASLFPVYLCYSFSAAYMTAIISSMKGGMGVPHLFQEDINRFPVVLPPAPVQSSIAYFLDTETAKIDTLVREYEDLIALLTEKRQALISHAVTRGLSELVDPQDPEFGPWAAANLATPVRFVDSGVEWLGEIPEGWEVTPIKWRFFTASGTTPDTSKNEYYEGGQIPWIRTTDLSDSLIQAGDIFVTELALQQTACQLLPPGTVLIAMYGGEGTIGKSGILSRAATVNQALCGLLPSADAVDQYVHWFVLFYRPYWMIGAESSRKDPNISQAQIRATKILLPPLQEQSAIVAFLARETSKIDTLVRETQDAIELLKEHRSALITAAVTGKINVEVSA